MTVLSTFQVTGYEFPKNNVNITVFDTPGLADATGKDEEYLKKIQAKGIKFDLLLFCTEMSAIRFRNDDLETMKKLTITLGRQLWDHAVVVLTFANEVHPSASQKTNNVPEQEVFSNRFLGFKKKIKEVLKQLGVPEEAAINMPFVPAGDLHEPRLPDRENWLTAFWVAVFKRINSKAKAPFLLANVDRIAFSSLLLDDGSGENNEDDQGSQVRGVSREEVQAMKELKRKMQDASFEEKLGGCLQKSREYDEYGNKYTTPGDPAAKRYVPPIEMNEASSRDVVKEMVGDDTGSFMSNLISPAFDYVYQTFFGSIVRYLKKRNT